MCNSLSCLQRLFTMTALAVIGTASLGSCTAAFNGFHSGEYAGPATCTLEVTGPAGTPGQEEFIEDLSVNIGTQGTLVINGVPVEIGAEHVRSLPNAELAFEIVAIRQSFRKIQITYEPRPTLPGIEISGQLVEIYRQEGESLSVGATTDLVVSSADGITNFSVTCDGTLDPDASNP